MAERDEEWGPWIEHDGKGCPCVGEYVEAIGSLGSRAEGIVTRGKFDHQGQWDWALCDAHELEKIVRYRIRRSRAAQKLREMICDHEEAEI